MSSPRQSYRLKATFGPPDLFAILKKTTEKPAHRKNRAAFDFDWMKRRVELAAAGEDAVEELLSEVLDTVTRSAGAGTLLPGKCTESEGLWCIPIGVLIQTPDVYTEMIVNMLRDMGMPGVRAEFDGEGFSLPGGAAGMAIDCNALLREFPFPAYIRVEEAD